MLYVQGVDTSSPPHLPVEYMSTYGDVLNPTQMRKFLFKLSLQLSDPSWSVISSKLPPLQIHSISKLPVSIYFVQSTHRKANLFCICMRLLGFICFCHKRKCPCDRNHDSHVYTIISSLLSILLKKKKEFIRYFLSGQINFLKNDVSLFVYLTWECPANLRMVYVGRYIKYKNMFAWKFSFRISNLG